MKRLWIIVPILLPILVGCSGGYNEDAAQKQLDIERKVNEEAMKKNPPKEGEGPGS